VKKDDIVNLLLLSRKDEVASARYRISQYLPYLEAAGVQACVEQIPKGWLVRRRLLRKAADFDTVLLQKRLLTVGAVHYLRRHAKRLVYDFDDAVLFRSSGKGGSVSGTRRRRFRAILRAADLVIAGNEWLRELAEPHAKQVVILPTTLDPTKYDQAAAVPRNHEPVTLGWIGARSTLRYLRSISEALEQVGANGFEVRLKVVSDAFLDLQNIAVEKKAWREEDEAADVASFDIGLAPSFDDPWSKGKCGLKILQYMAASLPVVCTPVGVQRQLVRDGENGYWASTTEEWVDRLLRLIASPAERVRLGTASRKLLAAQYILSQNAPAFVAAVTGQRP